VQGVAEVVPVSSSAQLALVPWLLRWSPPPHRTAFAAALHAGSCAGIALGLRHELGALTRTPSGRRHAGRLLLSCLPAAAAGLAVDDAVERRLGGHRQLAGSMAAAGVLLWLADRRPQDVADVGPGALAAASVAQVAALVPGVSRAGATLTALRLLRVERGTAARTMLLMSVPVTSGAAVLPLARADASVLRGLAPLLATGVPTAAASGFLAVTAWRRRPGRPVAPAAAYRVGLAAVVAAVAASRRRAGRRSAPSPSRP
jgi:undecaprenyl-diphosphatase